MSIERDRLRAPVTRVAEVTVLFWVAKAVSTALGEAVSDAAVQAMPPEPAVLLAAALFVAALVLQLTRGRYIPAMYWLAVAAVGIFGTMAADALHVAAGVPYVVSTALWAGILAVVFVAWWRTEGTLSVHEVATTRRELFFWAAVVGTFALGTAWGDLTAVVLGLGYLGSLVLFAALILIPAFGYRFLGWNATFSFWSAYVLTRPLGASAADWLGKPVAEGGVGIGSGVVSLLLAALLVVLVAGFSVGAARGRRARGVAPSRPSR